MNIRFYLFLSGVNEENEGERWVQDFLVLTQGFGSSPSVFSRAWCRNFVCFYWRLMLILVMGVRFESACTVSGKLNVSRVVPRLYGWVSKLVFAGNYLAQVAYI